MSLREHVSLREHACMSSRGAQSTELVSLYIGYWTLNNYYYYYLKARKAVIDLSQGVLVVNDTIVKGKYKYAEATAVRTHKVRLVNDCHLFSKFSE